MMAEMNALTVEELDALEAQRSRCHEFIAVPVKAMDSLIASARREQKMREALKWISTDTVLAEQSSAYYQRLLKIWNEWSREALKGTP